MPYSINDGYLSLIISKVNCTLLLLFQILHSHLLAYAPSRIPDSKQQHSQRHGSKLEASKVNLVRIEVAAQSLSRLCQAEARSQIDEDGGYCECGAETGECSTSCTNLLSASEEKARGQDDEDAEGEDLVG